MIRKALFILILMVQPLIAAPTELRSTFVSSKGGAVSPREWKAKGSTGKVISNLSNGVVVTKRYLGGKLEGESTFTFPHNEVVEKVEEYRGGTLERILLNYPSGTPMHEIVYRSPIKRTVSYWYENGYPRSSENYLNGKLISGEYFDQDHEVEAGVENGSGNRMKRDAYGQLIAQETIEKGVTIQRTEFHPNGFPKAITPFQSGKTHGKRRTFLPAGEPNTIETWIGGEQNGLTIVFKNGEKWAEIPYASGMKEGIERRYRHGKEIVEEVYWSQDRKHGPTFSYLDKGGKQVDWYYRGKIVPKSVHEMYRDVPYRGKNPKHQAAAKKPARNRHSR